MALLNDNMTLEEKLAAIEAEMKAKQEESDANRKKSGLPPVPIDPSELTMCEGCQ